MVVLPATAVDESEAVIERLCAGLPPREGIAGVAPIRVTLSGGLALAAPHETLDHLLTRADNALYAAKVAARNRIVRATG